MHLYTLVFVFITVLVLKVKEIFQKIESLGKYYLQCSIFLRTMLI